MGKVLDKNNNDWLGFAGSGGIDRESGSEFTEPVPLPDVSVPTGAMVMDTSGLIWYGAGNTGAGHAVYAFDPVTDSIVVSASQNQSCPYTDVLGMTVDKNNTVWMVGTVSGVCSGFAHIVSNSIQMIPIDIDGAGLFYPSSVAADSSGNIWIGTGIEAVYGPPGGIGLLKYDGTNFTVYDPNNSGLHDFDIQCVAVDPQNRVWVGTFNAGFSIFDGSNWTTYNSDNSPLPGNHVEWFFFKNGKTFISTQSGFSVFDGSNWTTYTPQNSGLTDRDCESVVVDEQCNVWVATECGLSQLVGQCNNSLKVLYGTVTKPDGTPITSTEVYLMKLDTAAGLLKPIDNTLTDALGKYNFATSEPVVYVHPEPNPRFASGLFAGYEDSAFVQQMASPIQMNGQAINRNIMLRENTGSTGTYTVTGMVHNLGGGKPAGLHLYLIQNGVPVATSMIDITGSFKFNNVNQGNYLIWVDKMSVNNQLAPSIIVNSNMAGISAGLFATYLELLPTGVKEDIQQPEIKIFPNPSTGNLNFITGGDIAKNAAIDVFDVNGQRVYSGTIGGTGLQTLDLSNLSEGIYILRLRTDLFYFQQRLIIQK